MKGFADSPSFLRITRNRLRITPGTPDYIPRIKQASKAVENPPRLHQLNTTEPWEVYHEY